MQDTPGVLAYSVFKAQRAILTPQAEHPRPAVGLHPG